MREEGVNYFFRVAKILGDILTGLDLNNIQNIWRS